jgi:hypothetical protein
MVKKRKSEASGTAGATDIAVKLEGTINKKLQAEPATTTTATATGTTTTVKTESKASSTTATEDEDVVSDILRSTAYVMSQSNCHVTIDDIALLNEITTHADRYTTSHPNLPPSWGSQWYHYAEPTAQPERTAQYVLVLDALNFCFWPLAAYEYEHLVSSSGAAPQCSARP